ncbi:MAG: apolipoprotein N-acyltransferase [Treponema sp.]|nr:apolipoprotein N-acyltransferase [Treponema sp.]
MAKAFFVNLALMLSSAVLFAGAFPNLLAEHGIPFLAWVAYVPVFLLLQRVGLAASVFWGAFYGYASYGLFNYWLTAFHPLAGLIVGSIYLVYNAALFFLLRLAIVFFPRRFYLVQWLIWLAYEYLCTKGFLGYPYGISGYSQWRMIPLIQIAGLCGVWGVSALVVFPSVWLGAALQINSIDLTQKHKDTKPQRNENAELAKHGLFSFSSLRAFAPSCLRVKNLRIFLKKEKVPILVWAAALVAALVYGIAAPSDYSSLPQANIALIQHNTDPWRGGIRQYRSNFDTLKRLSDEALAAEPKPDMVVWSETAFVPRIYWHGTYRDDQDSWLLVKDLLEYLASQDVPFVIGNDDGRKEPAKNPRAEEDFRVDYNAALLFWDGKIAASYRKLHLVPFTEHFPYKKQFPAIHRALLDADTHLWEKGSDATVFSGPGFAFSTPICFEDTFGYLSRQFVRNGAELIVNLSNDAWSQSLPAQNQHLSMAVFRAVENRRSLVRSTASGQTCGVAPNGKIIGMAPPFAEAWLNVSVPIAKSGTLYTRWGDYLAVGFTVAAVSLLLFGGIACIINKRLQRRKE